MRAQTQDVGLIFLSAMASGVAARGTADGLPTIEIVGTTLITCMIATLLVGVFTIFVGTSLRVECCAACM
jgi:GTP:adenosylcobinamide-phosphate guanylyltransferase